MLSNKRTQKLTKHNIAGARSVIETEYPFHELTAQGRNYTDKQKMAQFICDGFIVGAARSGGVESEY